MKKNSGWAQKYSAIVTATRRGKVQRASERLCEHCGAPAMYRHHEDYSKPLEVMFLCGTCHRKHHVRRGDKMGRNKKPKPIKEPKAKAVKLSKQHTSVIAKYLAKIGAKGGRAGKGTLATRLKVQRAAATRWRRQHPLAKNISKKELALHSSHAKLADNNNQSGSSRTQKQQQHAQKTIHRAG